MKQFIVDAFADRPFSGNPAAVCLLGEKERGTGWMQDLAKENNLSETAFLRPIENGFELRWFTPAFEVDLCGHATLASAHVLWEECGLTDEKLNFQTRSGTLIASRRGGLIELDFPATPPVECEAPPELLEALDVDPIYVGQSPFDKYVVVDSEETLRALNPDFHRLKDIDMRGVIVTSLSSDPAFDFISRFFAPAAGVNEDPVTGSAHCCLAPFWSEQLGKPEMIAFQASARGGTVHVRCENDRVILGGKAITMISGELSESCKMLS